jgi:hypothetical protein
MRYYFRCDAKWSRPESATSVRSKNSQALAGMRSITIQRRIGKSAQLTGSVLSFELFMAG